MKNLKKEMIGLILVSISPIINGFVIMKLWLWFIVTTFNTNPISIPEAIGIGYVVSFMTIKSFSVEEERNQLELFSLILSRALLFLSCGWIVSKFI